MEHAGFCKHGPDIPAVPLAPAAQGHTFMSRNTPRLCFIGFGEAGQAFASGLRTAGVTTMAAWDILFPAAQGARLRAAGDELGMRLGTSAADAISGADIVIAAVTAASSLEAAQ